MSKIGPYFDVIGRDHAYIVSPEHIDRLEPLFKQLERSYTDDESKFEQRAKTRVPLIGKILGFDDCAGDSYGPDTFAVEIWVSKDLSEKTETFGYICNSNNINRSLQSATKLVREATPYLEPCGLQIGFTVVYPWNP